MTRMLVSCGLAASLFIGVPAPIYAASQDECAIWLCLPGGFPGGCEAAHAAFIKRITNTPKPEPPLPPFSSCSVDSNINFDWGFEKRKRCKNPDAIMRQDGEGEVSCRIKASNEDGFLRSPVVIDHILWTDVPSLGQERRKTEHVWKTTGGSGSDDGGRP
ncbi:hypothetical protein [Pelagibius sp. Alg239-R121]|uniref:hypothetical protein n=1 Tax=Pelagibius sp. Alg239-R121 TaxID=2993448 RepID=UPI0024A62515|nr:hypothetical protein [Pelagibius sp. Alg239-R121]